MDAAFADALPTHLGMVLDGSESVLDFRHWFSSAWWEAEASASEDLVELASRIENFTYILDSGVWDEPTFVAQLLSLVNQPTAIDPTPKVLSPDRMHGFGQKARLQLVHFAPLSVDRSVPSVKDLVLNLKR